MTPVVRTPTEDDFRGFLRVPGTVRLGYLDPGDPATGALERLFVGADPWCPFFF